MAGIVYSRKAHADMADIWAWIAKTDSIEAADTIVDRIERRVCMLEHHPKIGRSAPEIDDQARVLLAERWLVLYAVINETVHIVRVVDGARDTRRIWPQTRRPL